ncbi:MAG TPA: MFS transporter [Lentimicrobium sp.]|nr:MFS transporter [Lentimicrobium sp.]
MKKYPTLLSLYLAQSIPMSFFSTIVPVIMRQEKYSLAMIGLLQLIKLPWIFKFLWAPLVDKYGNSEANYKRWVFGSEFVYAAIIISIGFLNLQFNFPLIITLMVIAFIASATQDIATDAFAILVLKKEERSMGNAMQSAGTFLGTMTGSGILLIMYHYFGWQGLMFCLAGFVVLAIIPLYFYKNNKENETAKSPTDASCHGHHSHKLLKLKDSDQNKASFKDIGLFFRQKGIWRRIVLLFFFYSGIIGILSLMKPFLVDNGFTMKQIGIISGICGTASGAISSIIGAHLIRRIGRKRSLYLFASFSVLTGLFFVWLLSGHLQHFQLYTAVVFLWISYGMSSVGIYTISMDIVRKGREGTDFTIQIVITHLSALLITIACGKLADMLGFRTLFVIETVFAVAVLASIQFLYRENLSDLVISDSGVADEDTVISEKIHKTGS